MESMFTKKQAMKSAVMALIIGVISIAPVSGAGKNANSQAKSEEFACPLISSLKTIPQLEEPALLMFYASWCPMCHQMVDAFNEYLAQNPKLVAYRIDVGGSGAELGQKFNVSGVPTLVAVESAPKGGVKEKQRFVGKLSLPDLQRRVTPVVSGK
jgi:thiol-disulfide isomerase/thioredoxin